MYYSREELQRVTNYKGGTTLDRSLLYQYFISPLCRELVKFAPTWLAYVIMMTFAGLLFNIASYIVLLAYVPNLSGVAPFWVYAFMASCVIIYMLLDNSDGKQAVRTGSSSPLGEIFDHGVDSCVIAMGILTTATVVQAGPWDALWYAVPGFVAFYLAHWQEYFNHFLDLGYFGPTEAEIFAAALYFFTGFVGPDFWSTPLELGPYAMPLRKWLLYFIVILTTLVSLQSIFEGLRLARKRNPPVNPLVALSQLIPFTLSYACAGLWIYFSPSLYEAHPHVFLTMWNLLFSFLTRMCDLPYKFFYWPMVFIMFAAANAAIGVYTGAPIVKEELLLYVLWAVYFLIFLHFCNRIINGFCDVLKIKCWTIPYPNKATKQT